MSKWRDINKEYIRAKQRVYKRERKLKAIEYLGGVCKKCGGTFHPAVYEFHHRDQTLKDRDPSKMLQLSWKRLQEELDKCDLLCANCHRLTHHQENYLDGLSETIQLKALIRHVHEEVLSPGV